MMSANGRLLAHWRYVRKTPRVPNLIYFADLTDQGSIMKKYEVIEAAPNRSGWRVVDGEFMVWRDISHHATKEEAEAAKAMYEWRDAEEAN